MTTDERRSPGGDSDGDAESGGTPRGRPLRSGTLWLGMCVASFGLCLVVYACAGASSIRHGDTLDVSRYPQDMQAAYKTFEVRCSRCHTLARPLNARIRDPQHWVRYVERMRLNPSSGINAKNGQVILRFLLYYMQQRQAEEQQGEASVAKPEILDNPETQPPAASNKQASPPAASAQPASPEAEPSDSLAPPTNSVSEPAAPEMNP